MDKTEIVAAIVAITQVFKYYGVPSNFCPMIAIGLGALFQYINNPTVNGILEGIVIGATVTGGYGLLKGSAQSVLKQPKKDVTDFAYMEDDRCH